MKNANTTEPQSNAIEVKSLVQFELPVTIKENRIPLTVITDEYGNPWWVAAEVCKVLGFDRAIDATKYLDADEQTVIKNHSLTTSRNPNAIIINEPGLYRLISRSRKPVAKTFQRWVFHEVLPEIRKTGSYNAKPAPAPELTSVDTVRYLLGEYDKKDAEVKRLEAQTKEMKPKAKFFDAVSNARGNVNLTVAAKMLGRGPRKMMELLRTMGILYYTRGGHNVPFQRHITAGHFAVKTYIDRIGGVVPQTLVTPKGLQYLFNRLEY